MEEKVLERYEGTIFWEIIQFQMYLTWTYVLKLLSKNNLFPFIYQISRGMKPIAENEFTDFFLSVAGIKMKLQTLENTFPMEEICRCN